MNAGHEVHFDIGGLAWPADDRDSTADTFSGNLVKKIDQIGNKVFRLDNRDVDRRDKRQSPAMTG